MRAILGLGSNEGDRMAFLRGAIRELSHGVPGLRVLAASPFYESDALLPPHAPADGSWNLPFLNQALECEVSLEPEALLAAVKAVEVRLGREVRERWAPRRIDIDVLALRDREDGDSLELGNLSIPHPGLLERPFALLPLLDLWPEWAHPTLAARAREHGELWRSSPSDVVPSRTRKEAYTLTELVGVLNITPDSFSDGGRFASPEMASKQAELLFSQGVSVLDIGAESTRPGSTPLTPDEEWKRLAPVIEMIKGRFSVDTRHAETATRAIRAGATWVNDVAGLDAPEMRRAVADSSVDLVVMHSLGIPPDSRRVLEVGRDPVSQLLSWGERKLKQLEADGISRKRVILDPGIGFGKAAFQSWLTLGQCRRLHELGVRILVGHSRKSFLSLITEAPATERDLESAVLSAELAKQGIQYLRIHDSQASLRALRTSARLDGIVRWV